ncbi:MAG TPA: hypothetical protein VGK34_06325 [Armatimonadota bacterium]|jgi:hypothetical protein
MKRWLLRIGVAVAFAVLVWGFMYLRALDPLSALRHQYSDATPELSIRFKDAKLVAWSDGRRAWKLDSKFIDVSKDRVRATFDGGIKGEMLRNDEKVGDIKADKVVYNMYTRDLYVPGTASVNVLNGPSIKGRRIFWNAHTMRLACEDGVDALLDPGTVHGAKMSMDIAKKEITIQKANGTIKVE